MIDILSKLICSCVVASVDYEKATVRVELHERDVVSGPLAVLQRRTKGNQEYDLPEKGEEVVCLFLPQSNFIEGYVIGSSYNLLDTKSVHGAKGVKSYTWADGSFVKYDEGTKKMEVVSSGEVSVKAGTVVKIEADAVNVVSSGDISLTATGNLNLTAGGGTMVLSDTGSAFNKDINCADVKTTKGSYNEHIDNMH